uniref:Amino acid transporter transmembrane domain-containing protein n=1 Tax=Chromera velia CCMP2878 TaxID=1169474 RepID=A0A0G4I398_9ALVE|eukprot:Cvel_10598.t1-p1 / transcript=Cvel_10598.t1 / gene=Cvel_10598 / organism=Chromera_velia_CCMP2878 / gene_product=hypothetical protein / transcript_product=hypothetical protein / location=Cvel_scaffold643:4739-6984(-) / protein_length=583 / sequence_SO=supercontig / SO=protein_coding / is_pseudo=false
MSSASVILSGGAPSTGANVLTDISAKSVIGVHRNVSVFVATFQLFSFTFFPYLLPWSFALLSIPVALAVLFVAALVSWHTGFMIGALCNDEDLARDGRGGKVIGSYQDMVAAVLGDSFGVYVKYVQMIMLFVYILGNTVFQAELFYTVVGDLMPSFDDAIVWRAVWGAVFVVCGVLLVSFESVGPLTIAAVTVQLAGLAVAVGGTSTFGVERGVASGPAWDVSAAPAYQSWKDFLMGVTNVLTGFGGNLVFPELLRETKRPDRFGQIVLTVSIAALLCNCALSVPMSMFRRDELLQNVGIFASIPFGWYARVAAACVLVVQLVVTQMATVTLCLNVELALGVPASSWKEAGRSGIPLRRFLSSWQLGQLFCAWGTEEKVEEEMGRNMKEAQKEEGLEEQRGNDVERGQARARTEPCAHRNIEQKCDDGAVCFEMPSASQSSPPAAAEIVVAQPSDSLPVQEVKKTEASESEREAKKETTVNGAAVRVFVRVFYVGLAVVLAEMLPFFGAVTTIVAAFGIVQLSFLLPPLVYVKCYWRNLSVWYRCVLLTEFGLTLCLCVGGLAAAFAHLVDLVGTFQVFADRY